MPKFVDAQQALGFVTSQLSYIEPQVIATVYPEIQYPQLIPVDTSANEWAKSVTYYSSDMIGKADWFHHLAKDLHYADIERTKHEVGIEMADIGYRWSLEEISQALMAGVALTADRAQAARRAYEEMVDRVALRGDASKNFSGLMDYPGTTIMMAGVSAANDTGSWQFKTPDEILADFDDILTGMYVDTLQIEMADTVLLPLKALALLSRKRLNDLSTMSVLTYVAQNNIYTFQTGRPLTIRAVRGLETAGTGDTGRMIAYRRDPSVLKMHIPMTHRFMDVFQSAPIVFDVPGIFRLGGLEVRRPGAFRYMDNVWEDAYE